MRAIGALAVLAALLARGSAASAQVTTEDAGSIVFFPKIVSDTERDTFIRVANNSNGAVSANCYYVSGAAQSQLEFRISLDGQQPTRWVASQGRDAEEPASPGSVPAVPDGFAGSLLCVEVDSSGTPIGGNHVYGYATIAAREGGDVAEYNAVNFVGSECAGLTNRTLVLGEGTVDCDIPQYGGCPAAWVLDHLGEGTEVPQVGTGSSVHTALTIVPCSLDLATRTSPTLVIDFEIITELEERFAASTTVASRLDASLGEVSEVFNASTVGAASVQTRITSPPGAGGGFVVIAEEFRQTGGASPVSASAGVNLHAEGMRADPDHIVLPAK